MKPTLITTPALLRAILFFGTLCLALALVPLRAETLVWKGTVDNNWGNAANWDTGNVPTANDHVDLRADARFYIINIHNSTSGAQTFNVQDFSYYSNNDGYVINMKGTTQGMSILEVTRLGVTNATSSTTARIRVPVLFEVGEHSLLRFTYTGTSNITGENGGRGWVKLSGNGILDIAPVKNPVGAAWDNNNVQFELGNIEAEKGTMIYIGADLRLGSTVNYGDTVIAGCIDTSAGGRIYKLGYGTIIISGSNNFVDNPSLFRDSNGYVIPVNNATDNSATHQNDYFNNNINVASYGVLRVESTFGSVRVYNGAHDDQTLAGSGTVGSLLLDTGIVSPGDGAKHPKTGKLTVKGNYNQLGSATFNGDGSPTPNRATLVIDLGKGGNDYDKLYITGSATIGAVSKLIISSPNGSILPGTYTFMTAEGGITGEYAPEHTTVPQSLTMGIGMPSKSSDGKSLSITMTQKAFSDLPGLSRGQQAIATYLDYMYNKVATSPDAGNPDAYDPAIGTLNGKSIINYDTVNKVMVFDTAATLKLVTAAMNQLSPQAYGHIYEGALAGMNTLSENTIRRASMPISGRDAGRATLYASFNYDSATTPETPDYEPAKLKTYYYTIGGEKYFGEKYMLGAALAKSDGQYELDRAGSVTDATAYTASLYAAWHVKNFTLGAAVSGGTDKYKTNRDVSMLRLVNYSYSDTKGRRYGAGVWGSAVFKASWFDTKPYAALNWMNWSIDGFKEQGPASVALTIGDQSQDVLQSRVGVRIESEIFARNLGRNAFFFYLDAAWMAILQGASTRLVDSTLNGYNMSIETPGMEKNGWRASAGVLARIGKHFMIDLGVSAQGDAGLEKQFTYSSSIGWRF